MLIPRYSFADRDRENKGTSMSIKKDRARIEGWFTRPKAKEEKKKKKGGHKEKTCITSSCYLSSQ